MINRLKKILENANEIRIQDFKYSGGDTATYLLEELEEYINDYEDVLPNLLKESKEIMNDKYVGAFDVADFLMTSIDNLIRE